MNRGPEDLERETEEALLEVAEHLAALRRTELDGTPCPVVATALEEALCALQGRLRRLREQVADLASVRQAAAVLEAPRVLPGFQPPPGVVPQAQTFRDLPSAPGDVGA